MRCRKHITDSTSSVGVCATCLRLRLSAILAAQAKLDQQQQQQQNHESSLPQSASPYISSRNSDATWKQNVMFYSTPQVVAGEVKSATKKGRGRISELILGLFRSKSVKPDPVEAVESGPACVKSGGGCGRRPGHSRNLSGLNFSLSPMVRPSPITVANGEVRGRCSSATPFCKNRSRKLADFGRLNY